MKRTLTNVFSHNKGKLAQPTQCQNKKKHLIQVEGVIQSIYDYGERSRYYYLDLNETICDNWHNKKKDKNPNTFIIKKNTEASQYLDRIIYYMNYLYGKHVKVEIEYVIRKDKRNGGLIRRIQQIELEGKFKRDFKRKMSGKYFPLVDTY
eukprot:TRINITY_DN9466_c0_g1_i1.p1 TRINITY_DN9466_c0_g1~~TRINITY_DN9466_c0_g1_i1.p1  ORF type:complete len:150 (-),score=17.59 TRINITY_DN9466_c0_g1_i1:166-615(-)